MNISAASEHRLRELIRQHHLGAVEEVVISEAEECYSFWCGRAEDYSWLGNHRYGGVPDLPPDVAWPQTDAGYAVFLMQVNLANLPLLYNSPLPTHGMLYYFLLAEEYANVDACKVLYSPCAPERLRRAESPQLESFAVEAFADLSVVPRDPATDVRHYCGIKAHQLDGTLGISVPGYGSPTYRIIEELESREGSHNHTDLYLEVAEKALGPQQFPSAQILGHVSHLIDLREHAWLNALDPLAMRDPKRNYHFRQQNAADAQVGATDWRLLWRLNSDFTVGTCFWDAGCYETVIRRNDLDALNLTHIYTEVVSS